MFHLVEIIYLFIGLTNNALKMSAVCAPSASSRIRRGMTGSGVSLWFTSYNGHQAQYEEEGLKARGRSYVDA
jgi:hypothetical protein